MCAPHLHATKVYRTQVSDCALTLTLSLIRALLMASSAAAL